MKIFEHELFFSSVNEEVYSEVYHSFDYCFSRLSFYYYLAGKTLEF